MLLFNLLHNAFDSPSFVSHSKRSLSKERGVNIPDLCMSEVFIYLQFSPMIMLENGGIELDSCIYMDLLFCIQSLQKPDDDVLRGNLGKLTTHTCTHTKLTRKTSTLSPHISVVCSVYSHSLLKV